MAWVPLPFGPYVITIPLPLLPATGLFAWLAVCALLAIAVEVADAHWRKH